MKRFKPVIIAPFVLLLVLSCSDNNDDVNSIKELTAYDTLTMGIELNFVQDETIEFETKASSGIYNGTYYNLNFGGTQNAAIDWVEIWHSTYMFTSNAGIGHSLRIFTEVGLSPALEGRMGCEEHRELSSRYLIPGTYEVCSGYFNILECNRSSINELHFHMEYVRDDQRYTSLHHQPGDAHFRINSVEEIVFEENSAYAENTFSLIKGEFKANLYNKQDIEDVIELETSYFQIGIWGYETCQ